MERFIIQGGKTLSGTIPVFGSKNAAGPALAASLLARGASRISNVPRIEDVLRVTEIIESIGGHVSWQGVHALRVDATSLNGSHLDQKLVKQMRSSVLFIGAMLARFGKATLPEPGGCHLGARPLDTHFKAFRDFGVTISGERDFFHFELRQPKRSPRLVVLREFSVTATENLLLVAAATPGTTIIKIAATEPHVEDLCKILVRMGARIEGAGTHTLSVTGKKTLRPFTHTLISDPIEAGTFLILGALAGETLFVKNALPDHLDLVLEKLRDFGVELTLRKDGIVVRGGKQLKAQKAEFQPYPGLPSDLQAPFAALATQAEGASLIHDKLYEDRFRYLAELEQMGARATQCDPHRALITGPTPLRGAHIKSFDLRAGATLIIAGLIAKGLTTIDDAHQVDRGYERIEERLRTIGADIKRISV